MLDKTKPDWWKSAVIYQIYPKSFQDTNGDGIGDIPGIISRLDYLQKLGVDGIWLSPVFASPQADNGYDISDYQAIDPMFGTMADMEKLIAEGKKRGISIIMDLVLNHSSDEHFWFREAKKSRDNPYHDFYVWRDGSPDCPPNDMRAAFGGSCWTWVPQVEQYYFHQFAVKQPDLNWENPKLRQALYEMIRFWMEKGVEGFRLDVIDQIAKEPDRRITNNGPRLHEYLRELSRETFQRRPGTVTVGEAWGADLERAKQYSAPDCSELSMVFQFQHIVLDQVPGGEKWDPVPLSLPALKKCLAHWQQGLHGCGWNSLFWNNHDLPRIVSRWGNDREYREESAKMLAILLYGMEGTPFLYQGEELGMTNASLTLEQCVDLETQDFYARRIAQGYPQETLMQAIHRTSRDNARTPMQWTDGPNAGFTGGTPWMTVNPNCDKINAQTAMEQPNSVFRCYQTLIALRKQHHVFREGDFTLLAPDDAHIFAYTRDTENEKLLVVCNFTDQVQPWTVPAEFAKARLLASSTPGESLLTLVPYDARMYLLER